MHYKKVVVANREVDSNQIFPFFIALEMRVHVKGKGTFAHVDLEYDCLHATTVMMVKVYINVRLARSSRLTCRKCSRLPQRNNNSHSRVWS